MKKILIIGIGAGDPDYVTMQAVDALNQTDVFFIMDKGPSKTKLIELRKEICRRYIRGNDHRSVVAVSCLLSLAALLALTVLLRKGRNPG